MRLSIIAIPLLFAASFNANACSVGPAPEFPTTSNKIIEVKIADAYFQIPESYFFYQEDKLPERDYVRLRAYLPNLTALTEMPPKGRETGDDNAEWRKAHPSTRINIRENGKYILFEGGNVPHIALTPLVEVQGGEQELEAIKKKFTTYMEAKPSATWVKDRALMTALNAEIDHKFNDPCTSMGKVVTLPEDTKPLVPMETVEKGLAHSNPAIRQIAVVQLKRHLNSDAVAQRLYEVVKNDPEDFIRMLALYYLAKYQSSVDIIPLLIERLENESSDIVLDSIGRQLAPIQERQGRDVTEPMLKLAATAKGERYFRAVTLLVWAVNIEVQNNKLKAYDQLSANSKRALDAVMDFYERPDVEDRQKAQIRNALRNSKAAVATPRYVYLMMKMHAVQELGDLGSNEDVTIPYLIEELKSNRVGNYSFAVEALGKFGSKAKSAVPYIIPLLKFDCPKKYAANGSEIVTIGASPKEFKDPTVCPPFMVDYTRQVSANALGYIGDASPEVINALTEALNDKSTENNARRAIYTLRPSITDRLKHLYRSITHH